MTDFSRRARWLNSLFPASKAPQIQDPGVRSNDVSLVQPYDGSGWGINLGPYNSRVDNIGAGIAAGFLLLDQTEPDEVIRLLSVDFTNLIGGGPTFLFLNTIDRESLFQVAIAKFINVSAGPFGAGVIEKFDDITPIVGPNQDIRIDWTGGTGTTVMGAGIQRIKAPLGTVFYV